LRRVARGELANVSFSDIQRLVEAFGFELRRTSGSHHVSVHPEVRELLNLQETRGQAKPYQIRQFLRLVERYALSWRGNGERLPHQRLLQR
jgi:predicted RNA binding protein YcfA (HicA-like mRNA interferase family)